MIRCWVEWESSKDRPRRYESVERLDVVLGREAREHYDYTRIEKLEVILDGIVREKKTFWNIYIVRREHQKKEQDRTRLWEG